MTGIEPLLATATDESNKFHAKVMIADLVKQNKEEYVFEDVAYKENCAVPIIEESQKLVKMNLCLSLYIYLLEIPSYPYESSRVNISISLSLYLSLLNSPIL